MKTHSIPHLVLAVDVGNSRIKFGLFDRNDPAASGQLPRCLFSTVVPIKRELPWTEIRRWTAEMGGAVEGIVAGANPAGVTNVLGTWPTGECPLPRVLDDSTCFPLEVRVDAPRRVGIDRLLNAVAANVVRPVGRPALIVDTGTATTVDSVSSEGAFEGGAILPGFELSARALHHYTALLPLVSIEELSREPHPPLGRNTREALRSGLLWGQLGAVRELVARLSRDRPAYGFLTGGGAALLNPYLPEFRYEPHLSLQGLAVLAEMVS